MDPESCRKGVTHTSQPLYVTVMIPVQLELWTSPPSSQSTLILADIWTMKSYRDTNISLTNRPETGSLSDGVNETMKGRKTERMSESIISRRRLPWRGSRISQEIRFSDASIRQCLLSMEILYVFTVCFSTYGRLVCSPMTSLRNIIIDGRKCSTGAGSDSAHGIFSFLIRPIEDWMSCTLFQIHH